MAGRFGLLTDIHLPKALRAALVARGWHVVRVVDVLAQETLDDDILEYGAKEGLVFVTSDERAAGTAWKRVEKGRPYAGMIVWSEERRRQMSVGDLVIFHEELAQEKDPFAAGVRYAKPRS